MVCLRVFGKWVQGANKKVAAGSRRTYRLKRCGASVVGVLLLASLAGCSGGGGTAPTPAPTGLTYPQVSITANVGQAIATDTPTISGVPTSYAVTPSLPSGLSLNTTTGAISGTPTAVSAQASYTVVAANASGSTSASVQISVGPAPPTNLSYGQASISATVGTPIVTDTPTVTGTVNSYTVAPALPAGLIINSTSGVISGTPTAATASASYKVTASNAGGSTTFTLTIAVGHKVTTLLELGHGSTIMETGFNGSRVLSADADGHWVLWDYVSGNIVFAGDGPAGTFPGSSGLAVRETVLADQVFVDAIANGLEIRATSDAHLLGTISYTGLNTQTAITDAPWWKLATDGSYICIGSASGLLIYSTSGQKLVTATGDYHLAKAFASPGQLMLANSPAGANVIQTVNATTGAMQVSPPFSGTFGAWFADGSRFVTALATTVWTYSPTAVQQSIQSITVPYSGISAIGGVGNWLVIQDAFDVRVYAAGAASPLLDVTNLDGDTFTISGSTLAVPGYYATLSVVDLSGSAPIRTDYALPNAGIHFAAVSATQWVASGSYGLLADGATLASSPRYFGHGSTLRIAGAPAEFAASTTSSEILVYDAASLTLTKNINHRSGELSLSSDGAVLAASTNTVGEKLAMPDQTLYFYALPSGAVISSYPFTFQYNSSTVRQLLGFVLSGSGSVFGTLTETGNNDNAVRAVSPVTGGAVIWSDNQAASIVLSPDGTLIAANQPSSLTVNIYRNGNLVATVPGVAVGWLDNNRVLINQYTVGRQLQYNGAGIFDPLGVELGTSSIPELSIMQVVSSDLVYNPVSNVIYSLSSGQPVWTGTYPLEKETRGAVSGSYVVYQSGHRLLVESQ